MPNLERQSRLALQVNIWYPTHPEMPEWARKIVRARDHFKGTVLIVQRGPAAQEFFNIVYCVQAPAHYLALSRLVVDDDFCVDLSSSASLLLSDPPPAMYGSSATLQTT